MNDTQSVKVNIRNIAFGGDGVGEVVSGDEKHLGISAFVPYTAPGELVEGRIVEEKERYLKIELLSVERPSAHRVAPQCSFFRNCGGCELQHISYDEQLRAKLEMIRGALAAGRLGQNVLDKLQPIVPSDPFGYRRRVNLHIDRAGKVGFYKNQTRSVVAINRCDVAVPAINSILERIADFGRAVAGKISSLYLEADRQGVIGVLKAPYDLGRGEVEEINRAARSILDNYVIICGGQERGGFGRQIMELPLTSKGTTSLLIPAGNFSQVNWEINQRLIEWVVNHAAITRNTTALDLYAGAGNFSLPLARAGANVTAVECDTKLVQFGRQSAAKYRLERQLIFHESSVEKFLKTPRDAAELLILDPPRSGLGKLTPQLPKSPRAILISCHLASFVRDIKSLVEHGYEVQEIQPFDMFAQTSYVEVAAILTRN